MNTVKQMLIALIVITSVYTSNAQQLKTGYYVTANGQNYRNIEMLSNGTIKASISIGYDIYKKIGTNKYKGITTVENNVPKPASSVFYLEIISDNSIYLYHEGQQKTKLTFKTNEQIVSEIDDCTLYNKYIDKIESNPENMNAWSFCANAALQLCNAPNDEARKEILNKTVMILKAMFPNQKCPCSDVIPSSEWNK